MSRLVSTFFYVGLLRPAPGTWGSAAAVGLGLVLHGIGGFPLLLAATVAATGWGFWVLSL
jgi:phosphatidylglycerophosphatase A